MNEDESSISSDDVYLRLFRNSAATPITINLLEETVAEARRLCAAQGWNETEGMRIIFANGLSYLLREQDISRVNRGSADLVDELMRLTRLLSEMQTNYTIMKHHAYIYGRDKQLLEAAVSDLQGDHDGLRQRLLHSTAEEDRLHAELHGLRLQLAEMRKSYPSLSAQTHRQPGLWQRITRFFQK